MSRRCHSPTTQAGSLGLRRRCPCRTVSCAARWPTSWWPGLTSIELNCEFGCEIWSAKTFHTNFTVTLSTARRQLRQVWGARQGTLRRDALGWPSPTTTKHAAQYALCVAVPQLVKSSTLVNSACSVLTKECTPIVSSASGDWGFTVAALIREAQVPAIWMSSCIGSSSSASTGQVGSEVGERNGTGGVKFEYVCSLSKRMPSSA